MTVCENILKNNSKIFLSWEKLGEVETEIRKQITDRKKLSSNYYFIPFSPSMILHNYSNF
jgi:hypothetical protein